jgi:hypothetical protein
MPNGGTFFVKLLVMAVVALLAAASPTFAHHSFAAEFDSNRAASVKGTITKVQFENPHIRFYVDIKDETGKVTNWEFEGNSQNVLMRQGWTRNSLKVGEVLSPSMHSAPKMAPLWPMHERLPPKTAVEYSGIRTNLPMLNPIPRGMQKTDPITTNRS